MQQPMYQLFSQMAFIKGVKPFFCSYRLSKELLMKPIADAISSKS